MELIGIRQIETISSLGKGDEVWHSYLKSKPFLNGLSDRGAVYFQDHLVREIQDYIESRPELRRLDPSVQYLVFLSQKLHADFPHSTGLNIASSRGATHLFEHYFEEFSQSGNSNVFSSPTTTLGNLSSWLAHELNLKGFEMSHSIACSSGLHALVNGVVWLESGRCDQFVAGASEASNTPFTKAQMSALKICQFDADESFPVRAMDFDKTKNTMALSEGAGLVVLDKNIEGALAVISGVGFATELVEHPASISARATCFNKSMKMALEDAGLNTVDAIVMHAPGTIKGDLSELHAVQDVFGSNIPALTTNKWIVGHTLGASGILSLEMGVLMIQNNHFVPNPMFDSNIPNEVNTVMVNAVGFGGNAVSIILTRNEIN